MVRLAVALLALSGSVTAAPPANALIDDRQFQADVALAMAARVQRRVDEQRFREMASEASTILLDARSREAFAQTHVAGAINLPFTEFTAQSLATAIPSPDTRVLIYCNNNFLHSPRAFATKAPAASLNLSTFTALHSYGYRNVYELAGSASVFETKLDLVGTEVPHSGQ